MRGRSVGALSLAALAVLVGHNVYWLVDQSARPPQAQFRVSSRDIEEVAVANSHSTVRGRYTIIHGFAQRLAGAHVRVPPDWSNQAWLLEHAGRVRVTVADAPMILREERVRFVRRSARLARHWLLRGSRGQRRVYQEIYFVIERGADRYVVASSPDASQLFVMPEALYHANARAPEDGP